MEPAVQRRDRVRRYGRDPSRRPGDSSALPRRRPAGRRGVKRDNGRRNIMHPMFVTLFIETGTQPAGSFLRVARLGQCWCTIPCMMVPAASASSAHLSVTQPKVRCTLAGAAIPRGQAEDRKRPAPRHRRQARRHGTAHGHHQSPPAARLATPRARTAPVSGLPPIRSRGQASGPAAKPRRDLPEQRAISVALPPGPDPLRSHRVARFSVPTRSRAEMMADDGSASPRYCPCWLPRDL